MIRKNILQQIRSKHEYSSVSEDVNIREYVKQEITEDEELFKLVFKRKPKKGTLGTENMLENNLSSEEIMEFQDWVGSLTQDYYSIPEDERKQLYQQVFDSGCFCGNLFYQICKEQCLINSLYETDKEILAFEFSLWLSKVYGFFVRTQKDPDIVVEWFNKHVSKTPEFFEEEYSQLSDLTCSNAKLDDAIMFSGDYEVWDDCQIHKVAVEDEAPSGTFDSQAIPNESVEACEKLFDHCIYPKDVLEKAPNLIPEYNNTIDEKFVEMYSNFLHSQYSKWEIGVAFQFNDSKRLRKYKGLIEKGQSAYLYWCARKWCDFRPGLTELPDGTWWEIHYWWML